MDLQRIALKFPFRDASRLDPGRVIPLFHRWIQEKRVEGLLIDVSDYRHVEGGPGVVLVGHEGDHAVDLSGGRPGFLYRTKRGLAGPLAARLVVVFRRALQGARTFLDDPSLEGRLAIETSRAELTFLDRLTAPNVPRTLEVLREEAADFLKRLYPEGVELVAASPDPRECVRLRLEARKAPALADLLARLPPPR